MKKISIIAVIFASVIISSAQNYEATLSPLLKPLPGTMPASGFADFTLSGTNFMVSGSYENFYNGAQLVNIQFTGIQGFNWSSPITLSSPSAANGTFSGTVGLNGLEIKALNEGEAYITILSPVGHKLNPLEELRGKITAVPEPTAMALMILGGFAWCMPHVRKILFRPTGICI